MHQRGNVEIRRKKFEPVSNSSVDVNDNINN